MKKIYEYFCLLFTGSLLPFLIVELYFQDYFTFGILVILASIILISCVFTEYLKAKMIRWPTLKNKKTDYSSWTQKKEEAKRKSFYYFRNIH